MKVSDIIREPLVEPQSVDSLSASIHQAAKSELGYSCNERTNRNADDSELLNAIRALGIEVLNAKSVRKYQGEKLAEVYATTDHNSFDWGWTSNPDWTRTELNSYKKPVPDFALERALQIKQRVPQVTFWVEEMTSRVDPFLIAHVNSDGYYIAVWEEARFESDL